MMDFAGFQVCLFLCWSSFFWWWVFQFHSGRFMDFLLGGRRTSPIFTLVGMRLWRVPPVASCCRSLRP